MIRRVGLAACALVLLAVTSVAAQQVVTGTVVRVDPTHSVVVLDNGQMYQATPQTVFIVNNQPTNFATIAPGTPVMVQYGQPVFYRDGRYVVVTQPAPAGTIVTAPPAQVATTAPYEVSGVVKYADAGRGIIRFEDGRNIAVNENVEVTANGGRVMLSTLKPGTFVVIRSNKPLAFRQRDNTYYVVTSAPAVVPSPAPVVATGPVSGTVVRFDQPNMIVLSDGRVVPATAQTVVMVDNRAVPVTTLQPGTRVVIYPNGQAAIVNDPAAFPRPISPEAGLREKENERNSP